MLIQKTKIRIEPDWNVKALYDEADPAFKIIRIEPDWNVKSQPSREGSVTPPLEQNQIGLEI